MRERTVEIFGDGRESGRAEDAAYTHRSLTHSLTHSPRRRTMTTTGEDEDDGFFMASLGSAAIMHALSGPYQAPPSRSPDEMAVRVGVAQDSAWQVMVATMAAAIEAGTTTARSNMHALGAAISSGQDTKPEDVEKYFKAGLTFKGQPGEAKQMKRTVSLFGGQPQIGSVASVRLPESVVVGQALDDEQDKKGKEKAKGVPMVDYRNYPLKGYVDLPSAILALLNTTKMDYYLIIGRPTAAPSAGLKGYKEVTTKKERSEAPFIVVIDEPGMLQEYKDPKYIWVEFALGDVFQLDVRGMETMDDYMKVLSKKGRWNYKDRQKKFAKGTIEHELREFEYTDKFIDMLWPLYAQTGEKNGFTVLTKDEFYEFHRNVKGMNISMCWDTSDPKQKKLVSFCSGVHWGDVIMPMWCGTDYENPLNRSCATYFIMLYAYVEYAINTPGINIVDLGASHRSAKTAIGFTGVPYSGYFRCRNSFIQMFVEAFMSRYYEPEKLIHDM